MNFFEQFGVQPVLLLAQAVNFLILLVLLNKFLYKPILKLLDERRQKIAESIQNAEKISLELQKIEESKDKKLSNAISEAQKIIEDAKTQSQQLISQAKLDAEKTVESIIENAKADIAAERQFMQQEFRHQVSSLVITSLEKIITHDISTKDRQKLTQKIAKEFHN